MVEVETAMTCQYTPAGVLRALCLLATLVGVVGESGGQEKLPAVPTASSDSSSSVQDTLRASPSPSGMDSVVTYSAADSIVYGLSKRTMYLFGNASIRYKELGLTAEQVDINWTTSILNARGVVDTSDSSRQRYKGLLNEFSYRLCP